jgi:hypothetical protein
MEETPSIDLTSVIVSVASAVVEANRILSEGTDAPMGITEFTIQYQVHASLHIRDVKPHRRGLQRTESGMVVLEKPLIRSAQLRHFTTLTPKERILTGYLRDADLTISTRMEPLPRLE